jgi:penicillin-binding protein 1A
MKLPPLKFKIPDLKFKVPTVKIRIKTFRLKKVSKAQVLHFFLLLCLAGLAAGLGGFYGSYRAIKDNLPPVTAIETFRPKLITTIYSESGEILKEFAEERRVEVPYEEIPDVLIKAIVATEDPSFFKHHGIDFRGILRAVKQDFFKILRGRRLEGGSTITQQLARSLFLHREQNLRRKLKEAFLALQIEKQYSKEKILELYCNHFYLNHGVYGVETAANLYFGKKAMELTLEEAAMIAGIFRGPSVYSPYSNADATLRRRNHVLNRLAEEGYITRDLAAEAKKTEMAVLPLRRTNVEFGAYFFEEVRRYIEKTYGSDALYGAGLKVYTTLNPTLQKYAESALRRGLRDVENLFNGWRRDKPNLLAEGKENLEEEWLPTWESQTLEIREVYDAIVLSAARTEATVRVKNYTGKMTNSDIAWTKARTLGELIKEGDVVQVRINGVDEEKKEARVSLDQKPVRNGGFLAIEPQTGKIVAMVGGYSFRDSQFNRTTQAKRQSGSAIKPFLYTAALENGYTLATVLLDEPTTFIDKWNGEPWSPPNYDRRYKGAVTFRRGLEESRNIITARLLEYISPQTGVEYCKRFGITSPLYPYLSLSLGTFEMTMMELVSAFSVFPNKGVRARPYFISRVEDNEGNVLEETGEESMEVIPPQTAYMITSCLQGVIQRGTGIAAADLGWALGGKTGTTDQYSDAWFVGFSPSLCAGVWVGNETMVTLGERQSGAVAALPVWKDFFSRVIDDKKKEAEALGVEVQPEEFEVPPNLSFMEIDLRTGLLATPICLYPFLEVFVPGTEPFRYCTLQDHMRTLDYYLMQKVIEEH